MNRTAKITGTLLLSASTLFGAAAQAKKSVDKFANAESMAICVSKPVQKHMAGELNSIRTLIDVANKSGKDSDNMKVAEKLFAFDDEKKIDRTILSSLTACLSEVIGIPVKNIPKMPTPPVNLTEETGAQFEAAAKPVVEYIRRYVDMKTFDRSMDRHIGAVVEDYNNQLQQVLKSSEKAPALAP